MAQWASRFGCPPVGGDIATLDGGARGAGASTHLTAGGQKVVPSFVGKMVLTCCVIGTPHPERGPVLRSTARSGDEIWVTGRLGARCIRGGTSHSRRACARARGSATFWARTLHAMIDISDGLGRDAGRVAAASGVRIEVDERLLPLHEDVHEWRAGVSDGEDYELCMAIAPTGLGPAGTFVCRETGTVLTRVGRAVEGAPACVIKTRDGATIDISDSGWDHGAGGRDSAPAA